MAAAYVMKNIYWFDAAEHIFCPRAPTLEVRLVAVKRGVGSCGERFQRIRQQQGVRLTLPEQGKAMVEMQWRRPDDCGAIGTARSQADLHR